MKNRSYLKSLSIISGILLYCTVAFAQEYKGKVVGVSDGDTFTLLTEGKEQIKVRLSEVDSPEKAQAFGARSKLALSDLIFMKEVRVVQEDIDRYGRLVGHVYVGGVHVNRKMVQEGYAWVYRQYNKDKTLLQNEQSARLAKRGLWGLPTIEQVPPWEWRKGARSVKLAGEGDKKMQSEGFSCGTKRYCKEMISCEEAEFYLKECGLARLDGDGDGVPCEVLCR